MLFDVLSLPRSKALVVFTVLLLSYTLNFVRWYGAHLHAEQKDRALVVTLRFHLDMAFVLLDNRFTDHQTQADTLLIRFATVVALLYEEGRRRRCANGSTDLPEALEQVLDVLGGDSAARVTHMHNQQLLDVVVARVHLDVALRRELDRVLDQIDQNLLQADFVTL